MPPTPRALVLVTCLAAAGCGSESASKDAATPNDTRAPNNAAATTEAAAPNDAAAPRDSTSPTDAATPGDAATPNDAQPNDAQPSDAQPSDATDASDAAPSCLGPGADYTCALAEPCASVTYTGDPLGCTTGCANPPPPSLDLVAARCILQHLRDDARGHFFITAPFVEGHRDETVWALGDGTAVIYRYFIQDLGSQIDGPRRFPRKDKAFFDACLAETDAKTVYDCLNTWWLPDACYAATSLPCAP